MVGRRPALRRGEFFQREVNEMGLGGVILKVCIKKVQGIGGILENGFFPIKFVPLPSLI